MWLRVLKGCQLNEGKKSYKAGDVFKIDDARGKRIVQADPPAVELCDEPKATPAPAAKDAAPTAEEKAAAKAAAKAEKDAAKQAAKDAKEAANAASGGNN